MTSQQRIQELEEQLQKLDQERIELKDESYELETIISDLWTVADKIEERKTQMNSIAKNLTYYLDDLICEYNYIENDLLDREDEKRTEIDGVKEEIRKLKNGDE